MEEWVKFLWAELGNWTVLPSAPISGVLFCNTTLESTYFCVITRIIVIETG